MTQHNREIIQALNDYLQIERPGYAVLLKGKWGSGKTFFVKKLLGKREEAERAAAEKAAAEAAAALTGTDRAVAVATEEQVAGTAEEETLLLRPIYITLYGLSESSQIDEAIKREISPILYGKIAKTTGKILKMVASAALRYNVDIDNDGNKEQLVCTIDPKQLFAEGNNGVKGERLLIFDDFERCKMKPEETLGYINYYVEQMGCHVIVIGDDTKVRSHVRLLEIKEKTIGREFLVDPELDEAIDCFISEADLNDRYSLRKSRVIIKYCFQTAGKVNLRILRQSLNDFCRFCDHIPEDILKSESFERLQVSLLINFLIVYLEYKDGAAVLADFHRALIEETIAKQTKTDGEQKQVTALELTHKYEATGLREKHGVMTEGYVSCVMHYLLRGSVTVDFLRSEVNRDKKHPWELLHQFSELSNEAMSKNLDLTAGYVEKCAFGNIGEVMSAIIAMLRMVHLGFTHKYDENWVIGNGLHCIEKFYAKCGNKHDLFYIRRAVIQQNQYYNDADLTDSLKKLGIEAEKMFKAYAAGCKDALTQALENLNDENADSLETLMETTAPDGQSTYNLSAIFGLVEPSKFVQGFVSLHNASKVKVIDVLQRHYHDTLGVTNLDECIDRYVDDINSLKEITVQLEAEGQKYYYVDKYNIAQMKQVLNGALGQMLFVLSKNNNGE